MGWYHVDHFGKGIFMGEARKIKYNEDFLAKYVPSKEEAIAFGKGEYGEAKFADYDSWPVVKKLAVVPKNLWALSGDYYGDYWLFCGGTSDGKACIGTRFVSVSKETGKLKSHAIFSTKTEKLFADARNIDERLMRREKE